MVSRNVAVFLACMLLAFTYVRGQSHIINDCLDPGDIPVVLYDQEVSKSGFILQTQEETLRIPSTGFSKGDISCLTVTNLDGDADGGYPKIIEGGVGYKYVILELKSQRSKGFDFRVTAYYKG